MPKIKHHKQNTIVGQFLDDSEEIMNKYTDSDIDSDTERMTVFFSIDFG